MRIWVTLAFAFYCAVAPAQRDADLAVPTPIPPGSTLVIGFLGGFDRWNDPNRSVRRLTLKLREQSGVFAESISNHNRSTALKLILRALDTNQDGRLDPEERARARIILYGQSWGGAAAIATASDLDQLGIPVMLTAQVDSVGLHDEVIPHNVHAAVNFYQHDPMTIVGRSRIRAADPTRTTILGNFKSTYLQQHVDRSNSSWARSAFGGSHVKMELDPAIWTQVERYIDNAISGR